MYQTSQSGLSIPNSHEYRDWSQHPFMDPIRKCLDSAWDEFSETRTVIKDKGSDSHFQTKYWTNSFPRSEQSAIKVQ